MASASPVFATFVPGAVTPATGGNPDLVVSAAGPARGGLSGGLAPSQFDPLDGYPAAPPVGSVPTPGDFVGLTVAAPIPAGSQLLLYCIEMLTPTDVGVEYELGSWDESTVPNVGYVARILNTYYPNGDLPTSLSDVNDKAAAVQAAIWFLTDKWVLDANQPHRDVVAEIVANVLALGPIVDAPPPSLTIAPTTAEGPVGSTIGPFTLSTTSSATVTATSGDLFVDPAGTQPLVNPVGDGTQFWARRSSAGPVDIQAIAVASVPSGNVYLPIQAADQKLILAQTGTLQTKVDATATAFDVGNLQVVKTVSGPGEPQRSAVSIAARCTDGTEGAAIYEAGVPPTPLLIQNIRAGSVCTVLEIVDGANHVVSVTSILTPSAAVTIPTDTNTSDTTTVDFSNVYQFRTGSLEVTKVVGGGSASQRGDVLIDVACSNGTNATLTFPAGVDPVPQTIANLPSGTTCTTTETDAGDNPPTVVVSTTIEPTGPVTIKGDETAAVVVSNEYDSGVGSLVVTKDTTGLEELRGSMTIRAECDDGSIGEQTYAVGAPLTPLVLDGLPIGTQCTVTEPVNGESSLVDVATSIAPPAPVTITGAQLPVVVIVTNDFTPKPGGVTVTKSITGAAAGFHSRVVVVLACEDGQLAVIDIGPGEPGPQSVTLNGVPAGDDCGVAELADGSNAAVSTTVTGLPSERFTILPAQQRTLAVVDEFGWRAGALHVTKTIDGSEAARRAAVTVTVLCSNGAAATRTFDPGAALTPIVLDDLPAFTTCRIEEPANGSVGDVGTITRGTPQTVTIGPGTASTVAVQNTFVLVEVLAEEVVNGGLARTGTDPWALGVVGLVLIATGAAALGTRRRYR